MKIWKLMLVFVLVLATVVTLAACNGDNGGNGGGNKNCEHTYDEAVTKKPTCTEVGEKTFTCSLCGDTKTEEMPITDHVYAEKATKPTCTTPGIISFTCECGATKPDEEIEPAKGHDYVAVVTAPTCISAGFTTFTCSECGDNYVGDDTAATGVHNLVTTVVELTAEQKASNPRAIGVEAVACSNCDYKETTENAIYVFMNFDANPEGMDSYTGSDRYQAIEPAILNSEVGRKEALTLIDMQEHLQATYFSGNGHGFTLTEEGKLRVRGGTGYIFDELHLASRKKSALDKFTISFDVAVLNAPSKPADASDGKPSIFFGLIDGQNHWDYKNPSLVLDKNSINDDGTAYELSFQHHTWGATPRADDIHPTGFFMELEKEYSIKLDFDYTDVAMVTLSIKVAGSSDAYQTLGTYFICPDYGHENSFIYSASGVIYDNFKVTAVFGAERAIVEE